MGELADFSPSYKQKDPWLTVFAHRLTNYIIDWYLLQGAVKMAGTMAGITAFLCLLAIPFYVWGKVYRNYWHHHNLVRKFGLETDHTGAEAG
jgi:hypothetical protein